MKSFLFSLLRSTNIFYVFIASFTLSLNSKGQTYSLQWQIPVSNPKTIVVDSVGNSYVVEGNLLSKYNASGTFIWQNAALGSVPVSLKLDNVGNIIAAGTKTNSLAPFNDFFVCKIDPNGALLWLRLLDSLNLSNTLASFIIDQNNNVILTGNTVVTASNSDMLTFKVGPAGNVIWCRSFSAQVGSSYDLASFVNVDSNSSVFIAGATSATTAGATDSMVVVKYSSTGNFIKIKSTKGNQNIPVNGLTHSVFFNNHVFAFYTYSDNLSGLNAAYLVLDTTLNSINFVDLYSIGGPTTYYRQVTVTSVKSYDSQNVLLFAGDQYDVLGPTGPSYDHPFLSTGVGTVYYPYDTGGSSDGILLNNGDYVYYFYNGPTYEQDYFIVNSTGTITQTLTTKPSNATSPLYNLSVCSDKSNAVHILTSSPSGSYLERYAFATGIEEYEAGSSVRIYPNPTNGLINIDLSGSSNTVQVEVYNALGQKTESFESQKHTQLDLSEKVPGIYFVKLNLGQTVSTKKIIKE